MGREFGARLINDALGILLGEVLESAVTIQGFLHGVGLIAGNMTGDILAIFPGLKLVVGPLGTLAHERQFAPFHVFDWSDLLEELGRVHG
jgi:hypothetical protein